MPADYIIDTEHRAVFTLGLGSLSILDLLDHMTRLEADPQFSPAFNQIADFSGVRSSQLSSADIRSLAARKVFDAASRRAFVIGPSAAFDPARMYATQRDADGETNIRIVHELEEAAEWTGIDLDAAKQAFNHLSQRMVTGLQD